MPIVLILTHMKNMYLGVDNMTSSSVGLTEEAIKKYRASIACAVTLLMGAIQVGIKQDLFLIFALNTDPWQRMPE